MNSNALTVINLSSGMGWKEKIIECEHSKKVQSIHVNVAVEEHPLNVGEILEEIIG